MTSSIYFNENRIILWSVNFMPSFKSKPWPIMRYVGGLYRSKPG